MTRSGAHNLAKDDDHDDGVVDHHEPGAASPVGIAPVEPLAVDAVQAAALIGVSRTTFYKLASAGHIGPAGVRLGKHVRYPLAELRAWAAAGMPPRHEWAGRHRQE